METGVIYYRFINFDLCGLYVAETSLGVCKINFENSKPEFFSWINQNYPGFKIIADENNLESKLDKQIAEYFSGIRKYFDLKIDLKVTDFQIQVFNYLLKVPYGSVISYGDIACYLGGVKFARAVGNALNKNPLPILIPCHRVIDSKGRIGGFAAGVDIKKKLLNLEKESICTKI